MAETIIWNLLDHCKSEHRYFNSFGDCNSGKVKDFIRHLRNAISHSGDGGLTFFPVTEGGDESISHIIFYDSNYYINRNRNKTIQERSKSEEFCLKLKVDEARIMVTYIAKVYKLIEKTGGPDSRSERALSLLEQLLSREHTLDEGTVAEQLDVRDKS